MPDHPSIKTLSLPYSHADTCARLVPWLIPSSTTLFFRSALFYTGTSCGPPISEHPPLHSSYQFSFMASQQPWDIYHGEQEKEEENENCFHVFSMPSEGVVHVQMLLFENIIVRILSWEKFHI
jgi:hypothetical protein